MSSRSSDTLITDEIVDRALWEFWRGTRSAGTGMRRENMRLALEAVQGDIVEAFRASASTADAHRLTARAHGEGR